MLYELVQTGYLRATLDHDQSLGPAWCELTERGYQVVAGCPTTRLPPIVLREIAARIEAAETPEERTRLQRLYDGVRDVGNEEVLALGADVSEHEWFLRTAPEPYRTVNDRTWKLDDDLPRTRADFVRGFDFVLCAVLRWERFPPPVVGAETAVVLESRPDA